LQSFGNETRAKQLMKSHLQGHIKTLLRRNDFADFTAQVSILRIFIRAKSCRSNFKIMGESFLLENINWLLH
jgi:hypothetical protein